ncbi:phospholipase D family nuclease [Paraburkholderia megapolitana]|uniref:phospholipase D family nuclease n=1 Tax=Paraburkholderia megapolitana TaxID=420953 RepID=UPI0038B9E679
MTGMRACITAVLVCSAASSVGIAGAVGVATVTSVREPASYLPQGWWEGAAVLVARALGPGSGGALTVDSIVAPAAGECVPEVGFSPEGSGLALVLKTIASARQTIRMSAYAFTSREIARALVDAKRRGVDVQVVVDARQNVAGSGRGASAAALNLLARAQIPVRTIDTYAVHHDKTVTVDSKTVETGSFNFSAAAARKNSEDVLVLWNCPAVAQMYVAHWENRWAQGVAYRVDGGQSS